MKLRLERAKDLPRVDPGAIPWAACQPFVENSRAMLIHRPRTVTTHVSKKYGQHIYMGLWCGAGFSGRKKFTFLDAPPDGKLLCSRCEEKAVAAGLPSAHQLTGKHVHVGKCVAVQTCCV